MSFTSVMPAVKFLLCLPFGAHGALGCAHVLALWQCMRCRVGSPYNSHLICELQLNNNE